MCPRAILNQLMRIVLCLVNEVHNLKDSRLGVNASYICAAEYRKVKLNGDMNFLEMQFSVE